ncbi:MAG: alkaline phosphatase [Alphaproteobacteria bacterium]|nr:MAG: alkaline phosphatase [Alphaproteobacteria bacterium]
MKDFFRIFVFGFVFGVLPFSTAHTEDSYYASAQKTLAKKLSQKSITTPAKNVILFIGDGMGISTVTATRILEGQLKGGTGEENVLSWETFPYTALSKTYNTNQQVPDSAGTATAFLSGAKTKAGVIGLNQSVLRGDCKSSQGNHLDTILELSEKAQLNTGIVTTTRITHATPAAAYAHTPERGWGNNSDIPLDEAIHGCIDIARQFVEFSYGNGIDVAFGGGRRDFLPEANKGRRTDGRNLIEEWKERHKDTQYVQDTKGLNKLNLTKDGPVLGLFDSGHMAYEADRVKAKDGQPSLAEMTGKALQILQKKDGGYFLLVEGGRIDHGHHRGNAYRALHDGLALAKAVQVAKDMTNRQETLIIVTADHSHGFVMAGYATRGSPILGKVVSSTKRGDKAEKHESRALDGGPYTTLGYYNGPGAQKTPGRSDLTNVDTEAKDYIQQALIPTKSETHSGEDVAIYADGPGAYLFQGVVEQHYIFHVMHHALRLGKGMKSND